MAIHIKKKLLKSIASEIWEGVVEMKITLWGHRPGFRCLAVFDVGGSQVSL